MYRSWSCVSWHCCNVPFALIHLSLKPIRNVLLTLEAASWDPAVKGLRKELWHRNKPVPAPLVLMHLMFSDCYSRKSSPKLCARNWWARFFSMLHCCSELLCNARRDSLIFFFFFAIKMPGSTSGRLVLWVIVLVKSLTSKQHQVSLSKLKTSSINRLQEFTLVLTILRHEINYP